MRPLAEAARAASRPLAAASTDEKNAALRAMAASLRVQAESLCAQNALDVSDAKQDGRNEAFLDRLLLTPARVEGMAAALESVAALPDPVGEVTERWERPNGLHVRRERLPLGVVLMIFESRPNVTSDAAGLCLKSGNAVILRGGRESLRSNLAILEALRAGLAQTALPQDAVQLVPTPDHEALLELLRLEGLIQLCIPRGGEALIRFVTEHARGVPVVQHYKGVCHVYVHAAAELSMARDVLVNAKTSRPGVCNAAECLLVDRAVAADFLPEAARALAAKGVQLRGCAETVALLGHAGIPAPLAAAEDYGREFLDLVLAVKVVDGLDDALAHIARYGSEHTEAILTQDRSAAARFTREVAASAVMVNASTRFNDGGELGLGAEIGISTSRLHAFGPMGLRELTAQKYVVLGNGQVR
jgi:glutamate-5-semialdehyde dehydrogenase